MLPLQHHGYIAYFILSATVVYPSITIGYGEIEMHASDGNLSAAALDDVRDVTLFWTFTHLPLTLVDQYRSRSRGYPVNGYVDGATLSSQQETLKFSYFLAL